MTPEEPVERHEQWLRAMESNQMQFAADLAAAERERRAAEQARIASEQARIASEQRFLKQIDQINTILLQVVRHMAEIAEAHRRLEETVDQYIRFRGDGQQTN